MKIEKLTENKIRIIIKQDDLTDTELDMQSILSSTPTSQEFLLNILKTAKEEIGFETDGHKLFIEAFSNSSDIIVFTITKFQMGNVNVEPQQKPTFDIKKYAESLAERNSAKEKKQIKFSVKNINKEKKFFVYKFKTFDDFCNFCKILKKHKLNITNKLIKRASLYIYEDNIYLTLSEINKNSKNINKFFTLISEFASLSTYNNNFESILQEHGKILIKEKPISTTMKFFI